MEINFIPVNEKNIDTYIEVGIKSYKEHYLHLWKNQDPSPFINAFLNKVYVLEALKSTTQLFYLIKACLLYTSPSPRDRTRSRMPSSA